MFLISCHPVEGFEQQESAIVGAHGEILLQVPAGIGWIGSTDSSAPKDEQPAFPFQTSGFYLMETEVTNQQYSEFLNSNRYSAEDARPLIALRGDSLRPSELAYTGKRFRSTFGYEHHPVSAVSFQGASAYCEWSGMRLPTEFEWELAARSGQKETRYPFPGEPDSSKAQYGQRRSSRGKSPTVDVRAFPPNEWGFYAMAGNVAEWTSSRYAIYEGAALVYIDDERRRFTIRGGDWWSAAEEIRVQSRWNVEARMRGFFEGGLGFRCLLSS